MASLSKTLYLEQGVSSVQKKRYWKATKLLSILETVRNIETLFLHSVVLSNICNHHSLKEGVIYYDDQKWSAKISVDEIQLCYI